MRSAPKRWGWCGRSCRMTTYWRRPRHLADRLCHSAPLAVRATKEVAVRARHLPWVEAVRFGETMRLVAGNTADATEGRAAFREKRLPHWQGK